MVAVIVVIHLHALHRVLWNPVLVLLWQKVFLVRPGTYPSAMSLCM